MLGRGIPPKETREKNISNDKGIADLALRLSLR